MRKVLIIVSVTLIAIFFLPSLLSLPPLRQIIISKLEHKMNAKVTIDSMRFSWIGPQVFKGIKISDPVLDGAIEQIVLKTTLWSIANQPYSLQVDNGNFQVHNGVTGSVEQIQASIEGSNVKASGVTTSNNQSGTFSVQGTAISDQEFNLSFFASEMPTDPVDCLLGAKGDLNAMLGVSFDINGSISNHENSGTVNVELSAQKAALAVQAIFTPNLVRLDAPLNLTTTVPPSIAKKLAKYGVMFIDPISLYVSNDAFFLPRPFSLKKLIVEAATLSLGRITVPKPDEIKSLATFLQAPQLANPGPLEICLTPADFSMKEGLLSLGRIDALVARAVHLCCWGRVNLVSEQVNMILGVPGDTLSKTMLISNVDPSFCVQVPVSGPLNNLDFDTKTAAVQVSGLIAATQAQKIGGNFGALGNLAGKVVSQVSQPDETPPQKYQIPCK